MGTVKSISALPHPILLALYQENIFSLLLRFYTEVENFTWSVKLILRSSTYMKLCIVRLCGFEIVQMFSACVVETVHAFVWQTLAFLFPFYLISWFILQDAIRYKFNGIVWGMCFCDCLIFLVMLPYIVMYSIFFNSQYGGYITGTDVSAWHSYIRLAQLCYSLTCVWFNQHYMLINVQNVSENHSCYFKHLLSIFNICCQWDSSSLWSRDPCLSS